jgi:hypothetical protein
MRCASHETFLRIEQHRTDGRLVRMDALLAVLVAHSLQLRLSHRRIGLYKPIFPSPRSLAIPLPLNIETAARKKPRLLHPYTSTFSPLHPGLANFPWPRAVKAVRKHLRPPSLTTHFCEHGAPQRLLLRAGHSGLSARSEQFLCEGICRAMFPTRIYSEVSRLTYLPATRRSLADDAVSQGSITWWI